MNLFGTKRKKKTLPTPTAQDLATYTVLDEQVAALVAAFSQRQAALFAKLDAEIGAEVPLLEITLAELRAAASQWAELAGRLKAADPNAAHSALRSLEEMMKSLRQTQTIFHQQAGQWRA